MIRTVDLIADVRIIIRPWTTESIPIHIHRRFKCNNDNKTWRGNQKRRDQENA